jgi:TetR/AcrR family transcriptional repressor of mexJK operon
MNQPFLPPRPSAPPSGRPTAEQSRLRHEELLEGALEMFLEKGYELTTMEALAAATGITKRTMYRRYPDKRALFLASVQRAIDQWIVPIATFEALEVADLETTLLAVARLRVASILSPAGLRLQRIIYAESYRFPEIVPRYDQSLHPAIAFLIDLFRRHEAEGLGIAEDPEVKALAFLSVVGVPTRGAILGQPIDLVAIDDLVTRSVKLLLHGLCRG